MSAVQFHCPRCDGLFQVDDSLAGIEVNCPHCQGLVTVPDFAAPPAAPPLSSEAMELSCPVCAGPFQVLTEFAGQQVHCPHCQQVVTVPDGSAPDPGGFGPPLSPTPSYSPPLAYSPPPAPEPILPPAFVPPPPLSPGGVEPMDPFPGGHQSRRTVVAPAPVESRDLYPPGYQPPRKQQPEPKPKSSGRQSALHSDLMLPPSTGGAATKRQDTDDLLPPGAGAAAAPAERKPLPAAIPQRSKDEILIPTERGYVGVHQPVKTIQHHGEEIELRKLTPEEKARRRLMRNGMLFAFCLIALVVVAALMMWR